MRSFFWRRLEAAPSTNHPEVDSWISAEFAYSPRSDLIGSLRDARCTGKALDHLPLRECPCSEFPAFYHDWLGQAPELCYNCGAPKHPVFGRNSLAPAQLSSYGDGRAARRRRW